MQGVGVQAGLLYNGLTEYRRTICCMHGSANSRCQESAAHDIHHTVIPCLRPALRNLVYKPCMHDLTDLANLTLYSTSTRNLQGQPAAGLDTSWPWHTLLVVKPSLLYQILLRFYSHPLCSIQPFNLENTYSCQTARTQTKHQLCMSYSTAARMEQNEHHSSGLSGFSATPSCLTASAT